MADSTLSIDFTSLKSTVGRYLGYGTDSTAWDTTMLADITECIETGLRQFYRPVVIPFDRQMGRLVRHSWSFMQPILSINTVINQSTYDLTDLFGSPVGGAYYYPPTGAPPIKQTSKERITELESMNIAYTSPVVYAVFPNEEQLISTGQGQRFKIKFYPAPTVATEIRLRYSMDLPPMLTESYPYPLGGSVHSETIIQSCLAAAELKKEQVEGVQYKRFIDLLESSVAYDRMISAPRTSTNANTGRW